jgi:hypothetical protein
MKAQKTNLLNLELTSQLFKFKHENLCFQTRNFSCIKTIATLLLVVVVAMDYNKKRLLLGLFEVLQQISNVIATC